MKNPVGWMSRAHWLLTLTVVLLAGAWGWHVLATRALVRAIDARDEALAQRWIKLWADPNATERNDLPVLGCGVAEGQSNVVRSLMKAGADVNARGGQAGMTPLMFAAFWGRRGLAAELLASGANVNATDDSGQTALFYAVRGKDSGMVRFLIERRANVSQEDAAGHTALWLAALRANDEAVSCLLGSKGVLKQPYLDEAIKIAYERGNTNTARLIATLAAMPALEK